MRIEKKANIRVKEWIVYQRTQLSHSILLGLFSVMMCEKLGVETNSTTLEIFVRFFSMPMNVISLLAKE